MKTIIKINRAVHMNIRGNGPQKKHFIKDEKAHVILTEE